jgi:hypothetical protein
MPPEFRFMIGKAPLMPTEHDATGAADCTNFVIGLFLKLVQEIVSDADVVYMAKQVVQRLQSDYECPNLVLVEEAFQEFDDVAKLL